MIYYYKTIKYSCICVDKKASLRILKFDHSKLKTTVNLNNIFLE